MTLQASSFISKELFVGVINSLQAQYVKDRDNIDAVSRMFGTQISGCYDNILLINSIFRLLRESFPVDDEGHCEIEHYCYVLDFGKLGEEYESPEELYDRLLNS